MYQQFKYYFACFLLGVLAWASLSQMINTGPRPYVFMGIETEIWRGDSLDVVAVFRKNETCTLKEFAVLGFSFGIPDYVPYVDNDGLPENFDREPGLHSFNITVDLSEKVYDSVEIRTRHSCVVEDGLQTVNKVFHRFERPNER